MLVQWLVVAVALGAQPPNAPPTEQAPPAATSVYRVRPLLDGALIGVSATGALLTQLLGPQLIHPRCPCDVSEVPRFDRVALRFSSELADTLSTLTALLAVTAPVVLGVATLGPSLPLVEDLTVYAQALAVSALLVNVTKTVVQRPLPLVYAQPTSELARRSEGYRAFYSGHTTLAVTALSAAAVTWTLRHGASAWPWLIVALGGGSVAVERVLSGRHFPSDVVVGALVGLGVGVGVPLLHARKDVGTVALRPTAGGVQLLFAGAL